MTTYQEFYLAAFQAIITKHGIGEDAGYTPQEVASFAEDYADAAMDVLAMKVSA